MGDPKQRTFRTHPGDRAPQSPTVFVATDPLDTIFVYVDEIAQNGGDRQAGTVTLVSRSGKRVSLVLTRCWFPPGVWRLPLDANSVIQMPQVTATPPQNLDGRGVKRLADQAGEEFMLHMDDTDPADKNIQLANVLMRAAANSTITLKVAFSKHASGNARTLPEATPLPDPDLDLLKDEALARMYLQFVEHFGRVKVDHHLADGGLTSIEIAQIEQSRPAIIEITKLFLQSFQEFSIAKGLAAEPVPTLFELCAMEETIFFQKGAGNDLARRNKLAISVGAMIIRENDQNKSIKDIGVLRRDGGAGSLLLYDRFGRALRSPTGGYLDTEFRQVDMDKVRRDFKIDPIKIELDNTALYAILRQVEQQIGDPTRDFFVLAASLFRYSQYIRDHIALHFGFEIAERMIKMSGEVIFFFVAQSFLLHFAGHPIVAALLVLFEAAGLLMGIDLSLAEITRLQEAGAHFAKLEQLQRVDGDDGNAKLAPLTELSRYHLHEGCVALIDAMADILALGTGIIGGKLIGVRVGRALAKGLQKSANAVVELTIHAGVAVKIRLRRAVRKISLPKNKPPKLALKQPGRPTDQPAPNPTPTRLPNAYDGTAKQSALPDDALIKPQPGVPPRALNMTAEQFKNDPAAQRDLFERATKTRDNQNLVVAELLREAGINDNGQGRSILKRDDFQAFIDGLLAKMARKKDYRVVGDITDIVRGRFNLENEAQVKAVFRALRKRFPGAKTELPRPAKSIEDVPHGYPRYHVDIADAETGMRHEWQVGTRQTTELFEQPGIDVGDLPIEPKNRNIHDVEYDILSNVQKNRAELAIELKIPELRRRIAKFAARTLHEEIPAQEMSQFITETHAETSHIVAALRDRIGRDAIVGMMH